MAGLPRLGDPAEPHLALDRLGVHRAIPLAAGVAAEQGLDPDLPTWVARDKASQVREWLTTAKDEGGFLVVAGDSSVGKTRLLYETASEVLADWPVLASPARGDASPINELAARADELTSGVVVWLDELHRYLPGPYAGASTLAAGVIARLRDAPVPVVILGTLWPEHLNALRAVRRGDGTFGPEHPDAADVLRDVPVIVLHSFNREETARARLQGANDPRLVTATATRHAEVTQALAGGPTLLERYDLATGVHQTVLWAAIDAQRVGVRPPLAQSLLAAAARGYLTRAHPADDWVQPALDGLSTSEGPDDRANALLHPHPRRHPPRHHRLRGHRLPPPTRRPTTPIHLARGGHLDRHRQPHQGGDALDRLGRSAVRRGLLGHAEAALTRAVDADHSAAAFKLAELLGERG